jgi:myo-inositol 2-dehydrogenase/D-chiro-inositol 1-dehydrogenase
MNNAGKSLGVAIVGSGRMGEMRGHVAAAHPAVRFIACSDRDAARAERLCASLGGQFHSGINREVIARPEVNAVIVSSAEDAHVEPVIEALRLGKPVLCEKPIGLSLAAADEVLEAIERFGVDVRYGYSRRFRHRYLRAKEQVRQGRLGKIVGGHGRAYNLSAQRNQADARIPGLSPVVYSLTYYVDLMCWLLEGNPVVEVTARGFGLGKPDAAGQVRHDLTWATLTHADGAVVNLGIYYSLPAAYPSRGLSSRVELIGTEGVILLDGDHTDQIMYSESGVPHVHLPNQDAKLLFLGSSTPGSWALGDFWGPVADETRAWLDHLITERPCALATAREARSNLEITLAIDRSAYERRVVRLPIER